MYAPSPFSFPPYSTEGISGGTCETSAPDMYAPRSSTISTAGGERNPNDPRNGATRSRSSSGSSIIESGLLTRSHTPPSSSSSSAAKVEGCRAASPIFTTTSPSSPPALVRSHGPRFLASSWIEGTRMRWPSPPRRTWSGVVRRRRLAVLFCGGVALGRKGLGRCWWR